MRLLWIGDGLIVNSISRVAHRVLDQFPRGWDVTMFAYTHGAPWHDPRRYRYPVVRFDGSPGQGAALLDQTRPDVICFFGGPGGAVAAADNLRGIRSAARNLGIDPALFCYQPLEVENVSNLVAEPLNGFDHVIVPAEFCAEQFRAAGLRSPTSVIGHGVDLETFRPVERGAARRALGLPRDGYIVGCVNGNFRRKRIDLAIRYFALWASDKPAHVKFYYHGLPNAEAGWDVEQLCRYYGVRDRLLLTPSLEDGIPVDEDTLRAVYAAMDVHVCTSYGEGFGLTVAESMACGVPQVVPDHSSLSEWPRGAVHHVPCTSVYTAAHGEQDGQNCIGRIADERLFLAALERLYADAAYREHLGALALNRMLEGRFRWDAIAAAFAADFARVTGTRPHESRAALTTSGAPRRSATPPPEAGGVGIDGAAALAGLSEVSSPLICAREALG